MEGSLDFLGKNGGSCGFGDDALIWRKIQQQQQLEQQENMRRSSSSSCCNTSPAAGTRRTASASSSRVHVITRRRSRRARRRGSRSSTNQLIKRKVKILKKLINPNRSRSSELGGCDLDNLFKETADYILALQLRVKFMHIMVNALSSTTSAGSDHDHHPLMSNLGSSAM
ncbi:hypothetical protein M9H77_05833 [Catharanthus roseus]|uniref:Uncharacterized protein n=1 Tax=Catharanthus roseus TaxID=4058 RepID=A0ACC0BQK7_CATRO|nr:hypothetical protein M9H77_05833 [Catharanthus roseus]